jgi:hypothetical protein
MRYIFITFSILVAMSLLIFCSCKVHSWMVLENPEFPDAMLPTQLEPDILNKYSVGEVIVHPRILYVDGAMTAQRLVVVFFSKKDTEEVSIKGLVLSVNGVKLKYGNEIVNASTSSWELYPANKPFYVCGIHGEPIDRQKKELIKARIDVSIEVSVKETGGDVIEKKINANFIPQKRSYLE